MSCVLISSSFTIDIRAKLGEKLSEIIPGDLNKSFLSDSGARANEIAIILAKQFTGKELTSKEFDESNP